MGKEPEINKKNPTIDSPGVLTGCRFNNTLLNIRQIDADFLFRAYGIPLHPDDADREKSENGQRDPILERLWGQSLKKALCLTAARPAVEAFTAATLENYSSIYTHDTVRQKLQEHSVFSAASERRSFAGMSDVAAHPAERNFDLPSYKTPQPTAPEGSFADQSGPARLSQTFAPEAGLDKYQQGVPALSVFNQNEHTFGTGAAAQNDPRYLRNGTFSP